MAGVVDKYTKQAITATNCGLKICFAVQCTSFAGYTKRTV